MDEANDRPSIEPPDHYRWDLIEHFRKRSDESANQLRALLIALATAGAGFIFDKNYKYMPDWHIIPILLFAGAVALLVFSWSLQKTKSIRRLTWLRDSHKTIERLGFRLTPYEYYRKCELVMAKKFRRLHNEKYDKWAMRLIPLAAAAELAVLWYEACASG